MRIILRYLKTLIVVLTGYIGKIGYYTFVRVIQILEGWCIGNLVNHDFPSV